ncbi:MAG: AhpC/TSA family protein [Trichormus sp. ATA11-4-KO1]|jgi:peroxiredoxin|nr:AhpC/TSA family protein [Trichormus sp. ATA11-4-KO1]
MTLAQEIDKVLSYMQSNVPVETLTTISQSTENLARAGIVEKSLQVGDTVPNFTLPNAKEQAVQIQTLLAHGPVVISFYRGQWCPFCSLELTELQKVLPEIKSLGASLVAISPQTPDHTLSTVEKNNLEFEVLSDVGNKVAKQFGLVYQLSEQVRQVHKGFGIDVSEYNGDTSYELPISATYVVAKNSQIVYAFIDPDYTKRLEPTDILTILKQL